MHLPEQNANPDASQNRGKRNNELPGTTLSFPELGVLLNNLTVCRGHGVSTVVDTRESAVASGFSLFDETLSYRESQRWVDTPNTVAHTRQARFIESPRSATESVTLHRVGLDEKLHGTETINTADISYTGVMHAYERLLHNKPRVLLLDGCAAMRRPELNNELHFRVAMDDGYRALEELKSQGEIEAFGLVSDHAEFCQRALCQGNWDLFLLNHRYTLLEQWPLFNLLPECEASSTAVIIGNVFNSGILRGLPSWNFATPPAHVQARVERIEHICRLHAVPMEAAALQFPLAHPAVLSVIVEIEKQSELQEAKQWFKMPLPASLWDDLKLGGVMHEEAPVPVRESVRQGLR